MKFSCWIYSQKEFIIFHIFNRIMSVKYQQASQQIAQIISQTQDYVYVELKKYQTSLVDSQNQIKNTITMHLSKMMKEQQVYKNAVAQLQLQVAQLKEDNSFLRNQLMNNAIKQQELKKSRLRVIHQSSQKQERIQQLAEQIEKLNNYMNRSPLKQADNIVNFDGDENTPIKMNRYQGLETIKEVSQHDLSMTMSLRSFKSEILNDSCNIQTAVGTENELLQNSQVDSKQSLGTEDYQIENYQDALMILKSYNSTGRGMRMTKKPTVQVEKCCSDQVLQREVSKKAEKRGNETINKIKRMRKIEDLDIQTKVISKANQQNVCYQGNEYIIQDQIGSFTQSKIEYCEQSHETSIEEKTKSSSSINSNKFVSRIKQNVVNLEDPIKKITEILKHLNSVISHPVQKETIKDHFRRISFVGGLEFIGHCNQNEEPSGFGKLLFNKQPIYQGQWRSGKFHGWGKLILLSFVKSKQKMIIETDGHFKFGMMQGSVVCKFTTGQKFMGMIKNYSIQKEGTFVGQKGIMTGYWENNKLIYLI